MFRIHKSEPSVKPLVGMNMDYRRVGKGTIGGVYGWWHLESNIKENELYWVKFKILTLEECKNKFKDPQIKESLTYSTVVCGFVPGSNYILTSVKILISLDTVQF